MVLAVVPTTAAAAESSGVGATATGRSDVCNTYLCGSGTFTWGTYSLSGSMSVKDNECNGRKVGIRIVVYHFDGTAEMGTLRVFNGNCESPYQVWNGLSWSDSKKIQGFRVAGWQEGDDYYHAGNYVDNPLT
ncbi:MAG TPA: hypothetical protein VK545_23410 [Streptomyces sp.]|nr:hypothetical protein [Streptomyces sp.]